ncbi:MAG: hypothetical protein ACREPQ_14635 [Rhodanobacter sp.]
MQPATNVVPFTPPTNLNELNEALRNLSLETLTGPAALTALRVIADKQVITRALASAGSTADRNGPRARGFLANAISRANQNAGEPAPAERDGQRLHPPGVAPPPREPSSQGAQNNRPPTSPESRQQPVDRTAAAEGTAPQRMPKAVKIYGSRAALQVEEHETRHGSPTVLFELATAVSEKVYNWKEKLQIQLTQDELPMLAALILGKIRVCEFKHHGADASKWLTIEHQGTKLYVKGGAKGIDMRVLPVNATDSARIGALVLAQLQHLWFDLDFQGVLALLSTVIGGMNGKGEAAGRQ